VQYVLGHADFFGLRLRVSPDVLIPRPETEELVERALAAIAGVERPWVLDVGTGSGAIALALKARRPDAVVFACDVSQAALDVAQENAAAHGLDVAFIHADALAPAFADEAARAFDLLVSNPPYVPDAERDELQPEVRDWEPGLALFTGEDPLRAFRALVGHALRLLKPGGHLLLETHADYGADVLDLVETAAFAEAWLHRDLAGRDRIVEAVYAAEDVEVRVR
jgi:release factor glutamine methyltransferase